MATLNLKIKILKWFGILLQLYLKLKKERMNVMQKLSYYFCYHFLLIPYHFFYHCCHCHCHSHWSQLPTHLLSLSLWKVGERFWPWISKTGTFCACAEKQETELSLSLSLQMNGRRGGKGRKRRVVGASASFSVLFYALRSRIGIIYRLLLAENHPEEYILIFIVFLYS